MIRSAPMEASSTSDRARGLLGLPGKFPRCAIAAVILIGLLLQLPLLFAGFFVDDYVLGLALGESGGLMPMKPWSLFDFGARADWAAFELAHGSLPWWTSPDWTVRFLRPVASLSFALDHAVWGDRALGHHFTSLTLHALLLALVHRLYRTLGLGRGVALLGLAIFALGDASVLPVGWVANRNALLEAVFAVAALTVAQRSGGSPARLASALVLAALAALSKESGALAFLLVAWTVAPNAPAEDPVERRRARLAVWIALAAFAAWVALLALGGYGTRSLFYATPWREPLRYLSNLALLAAGASLSLVGPWPIDAVVAIPRLEVAVLLAGVLIGLPLWIWIARSLLLLPDPERRGAILLGLWTVLFLLPQAGAVPGDRLLFVSSIGSCGLVARHLALLRERWRAGRLRLAGMSAAAVLLLSATLGSGALTLVQGLGMASLATELRAAALATDVGPTEDGPVHVLVLQTESQIQGFSLGATWHGERRDPQVRFSLLQNGPRPLRWTRVSPSELELESLGEPFLCGPFERVYLAREAELESAAGWRAEVFEVRAVPHPSNELRRLRFRFDRPLDDPTLRFVLPARGVLARVRPPAVGESVELPAPERVLPFAP